MWYEPYNDVDYSSSLTNSNSNNAGESGASRRPCRNRTSTNTNDGGDDYEYNGVQAASFCDELQQQDDESSSSSSSSIYFDQSSSEQNQQARYDHCMFEVNKLR